MNRKQHIDNLRNFSTHKTSDGSVEKFIDSLIADGSLKVDPDPVPKKPEEVWAEKMYLWKPTGDTRMVGNVLMAVSPSGDVHPNAKLGWQIEHAAAWIGLIITDAKTTQREVDARIAERLSCSIERSMSNRWCGEMIAKQIRES